MLHVVSFSGGKDSTAMLLHMMELQQHIDEVIMFDTGMEFPGLYEHVAKIREMVEAKGIKFTVLKSDRSFEYYLTEHKNTCKKDGTVYKGFGWAAPKSRWCTSKLKTELQIAYMKKHYNGQKYVNYVGLAADELDRVARKNNTHNVHPLVEWGWTEADCLKYCYEHGFDWGGLYEHFTRVSCWCCPLQSLKALKALHDYYPELWQRLLELNEKCKNAHYPQFKIAYSLEYLDKRFKFQNMQKDAGLCDDPKKKAFKEAFKKWSEEQ